MVSSSSRSAVVYASVVLLAAVSAGCGSPLSAPNDAVISVENEDDVAHTVQVRVGVGNRTVASGRTRVGPGNERTLNGTTVPVAGTDGPYQVSVSLADGRTNSTTFAEREFDAVKITIGEEGTIRIGWIDAA